MVMPSTINFLLDKIDSLSVKYRQIAIPFAMADDTIELPEADGGCGDRYPCAGML